MTLVDPQNIPQETRTIAGRPVPVKVMPRPRRSKPKVCPAIGSLLRGMRVTGSYFRPSKIVTRQYPENRATLKLFERFRASLRLVTDAQGRHRCTGCGLCQKACPNASIRVLTRKGPVSNKKELDRYIWRQDSCTYCNLCVQSCPFGALEMSGEFENAVYDRRLLIYTLNRYAAPAANALDKVEDPAQRQAMMEERDRYGGPVPLNGQTVPGLSMAPLAPAGGEAAADAPDAPKEAPPQ